jgi:hypothetical protein
MSRRVTIPFHVSSEAADDKGSGVFQVKLTPELQIGHTAHPTVYLNNLSFTNTFANIDKGMYDNADLELAVAGRAAGVDSSVTVTITLDKGNYSLAELEAAIADKLYKDLDLLPYHVARVTHDGGFAMTNAVMRGTSGSVSTNIIATTTSALALPVVPQDHSNSGLRYAEALTIDECLDLESDGTAPHKLPPVHKGLLSTSNAVSDGFTFGFKPVMLEADLQSNRVRMCLGAGVTMSTAQQASSTLLTKVLGIQSTQQGVQDSTHTFKLFDTSQQVAARIDKTRAVSFHCPSLASGTYSTKGVHGDSQLALVPITVPVGAVQSWETFEPIRIPAPIAGTTRNELTFYITNEEGEPVNTLGERFEAVMVVEYDVPLKR